MALRTAAAADLDATVSTLKTQLATYVALQQTGNDAPAVLFWQWLIQQLRDVDPAMAQAIDTANMNNSAAWGHTLSEIDGYA